MDLVYVTMQSGKEEIIERRKPYGHLNFCLQHPQLPNPSSVRHDHVANGVFEFSRIAQRQCWNKVQEDVVAVALGGLRARGVGH